MPTDFQDIIFIYAYENKNMSYNVYQFFNLAHLRLT